MKIFKEALKFVLYSFVGIVAFSLFVIDPMRHPTDSRLWAVKADFSSFEKALEMYYDDNGFFPTTEQGIDALVSKPKIEPIPPSYRESSYFERTPKDPWANYYQYEAIDNGSKNYVLVWSKGEDEISGTNDDYAFIHRN